MRKLIVQIPCYNEADTLPQTLAEIPREIPGVDEVEVLVVDDGSTDGTGEVARTYGADHVVRHTRNQGLAAAFRTGLDAGLRLEADVIVNTDADNQYCADDVPKLAGPILRGTADVVVGERPIRQIEHFSLAKKLLQRLGSWSVRIASGTNVHDAPSGFRAFSREAALRLNVFNEYTYTLETLVQAGQSRMAVQSVPIRTNGVTRPSRLIRSVPRYVARSALTIVRSFVTYRPFRTFAVPGTLLFAAGFLLGLRFLYFYLTDGGAGHVQSVILAALLLGTGFFLVVIGLIADLISVNRRLLELTLEETRRSKLTRRHEEGSFHKSSDEPATASTEMRSVF